MTVDYRCILTRNHDDELLLIQATAETDADPHGIALEILAQAGPDTHTLVVLERADGTIDVTRNSLRAWIVAQDMATSQDATP